MTVGKENIWMSKSELQKMISNGVDLRIIAELNACKMSDIEDIVYPDREKTRSAELNKKREGSGVNPDDDICGNRRRTIDNSEVPALYDQGYTDREIEEITGFRASSISRWRAKNELDSNYVRASSETVDLRRRLYDEGYSDILIAMKTGETEDVVARWRGNNGLLKNGSGKGRPAIYDKSKWMSWYEEGHSVSSITKMAGCSDALVRMWMRGKGIKPHPRGELKRRQHKKTTEQQRS